MSGAIIISRMQPTREDILSGIQFQIERIESSICAFDARKMSYEQAKQISHEANGIIEKLQAVYTDTFSVPLAGRNSVLDAVEPVTIRQPNSSEQSPLIAFLAA
jgi:hypothetical protein